MSMEKRGQAAMEFLMTYGWAILAAVVAIGVLAYFGVFSPGKLAPDRCYVSSPFGCEDYTVTTSGVQMILRNGVGETVTISNVSITNCGSITPFSNVTDGSTTTANVTCSSSLSSGGKFRGNIEITYQKSGGTFDHKSSGDITGVVA